MFIVLESEIITLMLTQTYYSNISIQLLNSINTLTILSIIWSSAPLTKMHTTEHIITAALKGHTHFYKLHTNYFLSRAHEIIISFARLIIPCARDTTSCARDKNVFVCVPLELP